MLSSSEDSSGEENTEEIKLAAYNDGFKSGYEEGLSRATGEMDARLEIVENYLQALSHPFNDQNQQLAEYIAALAGKIAKSLVRRELRTEPETIVALVRDTVSALNTNEQEVFIHLNPENAKLIRELINADSEEESWKIVDDPMISRSDCKVRSKDSLVDTDLQSRIDLIITQFLGDERSESRA